MKSHIPEVFISPDTNDDLASLSQVQRNMFDCLYVRSGESIQDLRAKAEGMSPSTRH